MRERKWITVNGVIEVDCETDEFDKVFLEFLESNGWSFVGYSKEVEEE